MAAIALCAIVGCGKKAHAKYWCTDHYNRWVRWGHPLVRPYKRTIQGEPYRFFQNTVLSFDGEECLMWPYGCTKHGYGCLTRNNRKYRVSRLACELVNGPPPTAKHEAAHNCGNRRCCNPRHLRWATPKENQADKIIHGTHNRGRRYRGTRLTANDIAIIRSLRGKEKQKSIAERFGIGLSTVSQIQTGKSWSWLKHE